MRTVAGTVDTVIPQAVNIVRQNGYKGSQTVATTLGFNPYKVVGKYGTRDGSWTCNGSPSPAQLNGRDWLSRSAFVPGVRAPGFPSRRAGSPLLSRPLGLSFTSLASSLSTFLSRHFLMLHHRRRKPFKVTLPLAIAIHLCAAYCSLRKECRLQACLVGDRH